MTTRFSLAELADMLDVRVEWVRTAVDALAEDGQLTAESFQFGDRNWRIAPSDVKRIQGWITAALDAGHLAATGKPRRVKRKQVLDAP